MYSNQIFNINVFHSYFLRHKYEFLHNGWSPDLRITVNPVRIGVALDYQKGTLSFFNVDLKQHLHTFLCRFQNYVHPCFGFDSPGALTVHNAIGAPEYAFIWPPNRNRHDWQKLIRQILGLKIKRIFLEIQSKYAKSRCFQLFISSIPWEPPFSKIRKVLLNFTICIYTTSS